MPKPRSSTGEKNLIADKLKHLREQRSMSQRKLAMEFQLIGCDIDRNVITRIESNQRYVTDIELCAIMKVFGVESSYLLEDQEDHGRIEGSRTEGRRAEGSQTEGGRAEEGRTEDGQQEP